MSLFKIYIDGCCLSKQGPAGIGVAIFNPQNEAVLKISEIVKGPVDGDRAVFYAFKRAIEEIRRLKIDFAKIYLHNETACRQIQGIYRIMDPILKQMKNAIKKDFSDLQFEVELISSTENREAKNLAEEAAKKNTETFEWGESPLKMSFPIESAGKISSTPPLQDIQCSAGGVLYRKEGRKFKICMISKGKGKIWALPKGRVASGETPQETAVREVSEETGHLAQIESELDKIDYYFYWKDNNTFYHKHVYYFLMSLIEENARVRDSEADEVAWLPLGEAYHRATYINEKKVIHKSKKIFDNT